MAIFGVPRTLAASSVLGANPMSTAPARRIDSMCFKNPGVSRLQALRNGGSAVSSTTTKGLAASMSVALTENGLSFLSVTRMVSLRFPVGKSLPVMLPAGETKDTLTSLPVPLTPGME